ncbi:MAG: flagellar protein FlaG [Nitrospiraceae bacterium]
MIREINGHGTFSVAGGRAEDGKPSQLKEKVAEPTKPSTVERAESRETRPEESHASRVVPSVNHELHYEVDADLKRVVTKILDGTSGELVRQIPSEEAVRIAKVLESASGDLVDRHV